MKIIGARSVKENRASLLESTFFNPRDESWGPHHSQAITQWASPREMKGEKRGRSLCERRGEKRGGNKVKSEERKGWKRKGGWRREDVGEEEKKGGKEKRKNK